MEFYLVFSVFYVHLVHIFPPNFSVRRHGIQEVSGSIPLISTKKVLKTPVFGTFSLLFGIKKFGVLKRPENFDHNLTTITLCFIGPISLERSVTGKHLLMQKGEIEKNSLLLDNILYKNHADG